MSYHSFLLRLWLEEEGQTPSDATGWQAEVESIQSGDTWRFADVASLIAFFEDSFPAANNNAGLAS